MALKRNERIIRPEPMQGRFVLVVMTLVLGFSALLARAAYIQVIEPDQLRHESEKRTVRVSQDRIQRGNISDRHGVDLAVSVPVHTIWADPQTIHQQDGLADERRWRALAEVLNTDSAQLLGKVDDPSRRFVYLERMVTPAVANYVEQLGIPGIALKEESRRFYPTGEISAHVVGLTNIDGQGLDGIESTFNQMLTGQPGQRRFLRDGRGRVIEETEVVNPEMPQSLILSLDQRLQATAYRELKRAVEYHRASSGSLVALDVETGEILAMVNSPSFNPNNRRAMQPHQARNRAVADTFEPGSTIKPLVVLSALSAGTVEPDTKLETGPGYLQLGGRRVQDIRPLDDLDVTGVLTRSSNVGSAQLALDMELDDLLDSYYQVGIGHDTGVTLPGESAGRMPARHHWSDFERATLSYGYGLTMTTLQLAQMYSVLANGGVLRPLSILAQDQAPEGRQVFDPALTRDVMTMLETVTGPEGTGQRARVPGYRVAGKTGTTRKAIAGGYGDEYVALFAGALPASNPRVAIAVMINEPSGDNYHGGSVAAPVFSEVAADAMRLLQVPPDNLNSQELHAAGWGQLQ